MLGNYSGRSHQFVLAEQVSNYCLMCIVLVAYDLFFILRLCVMNSLTAYFHRTLPVASVNVTLDGVPEVNSDVSSCILGPWYMVDVHVEGSKGGGGNAEFRCVYICTYGWVGGSAGVRS